MASLNAVTSMPFACDNGGCNKRFRPLVPKLTLSPSSTPVAGAVWSQQCEQYNQQVFCSTSGVNNLQMSAAAACFLDKKINKLDGEVEANVKDTDHNDMFISGNAQQQQKLNMKEEVEICAQSHPSGTRWNPTPEQIKILEMFYKGGMRTPNAEQIEHITAQLRQYGKIEGKNVFYWFQNHKARERQKQKRNSMAAAAAATKRVSPTGDNTTNNATELHKPNPNGAYSFYNLPFAATSETSWPIFNSSSFLTTPFSKGLVSSLGLDLKTSPPPKRDLDFKTCYGPLSDLGTGMSPSKNTTWDSFGNGDGLVINMGLRNHQKNDFTTATATANANSCKRKNRMWQTPNEDLSLHTESSSESICLQTSDNNNDNNKEEEDRKHQTLELFPLSPEGSLKSTLLSAESSTRSNLVEFLPKHSGFSI